MEAFQIAINSHDRENPDHPPAYGIGMARFDLERLGFEEGEEILPGIKIIVDGKTSGNFRVLCDYEAPEEKTKTTDAVSSTPVYTGPVVS